jgi:hypothetical protein
LFCIFGLDPIDQTTGFVAFVGKGVGLNLFGIERATSKRREGKRGSTRLRHAKRVIEKARMKSKFMINKRR